MSALSTRPWITAAVALAGAGVIAATPVTAPLPGVLAAEIQLASSETNMVLDLVRHGQSEDNVSGVIGTVPPGAPLTAEGATQAAYLANPDNPDALQAPSYYDGIYASEFIRTQETAQDWLTAAGAPDTPVTDLSGLNELNAGVLEGTNESSQLTALLYLVAPMAWMFGQYWVPQLGSTIDPNGMEFEQRFSDAVDTIYNNGGTLADGDLHDVAFSHAAAISTWVMMNVKNPDFDLYFKMLEQGILPNTGQVVIEGNPTDGWTLVSWDGTAVPQDPGLGTELFVDFRDLITAPQMAFYNIEQAFEAAFTSNDWSAALTAVQDGFEQIGNAFMQFPINVWDDILAAA